MNFEKDDDTCCSSWADYPGPSWSLTKTCLHQRRWGEAVVGPGGRPADRISVTSRGVRPGITQGKAAKQRRRKQSLCPTAFSILSTSRGTHDVFRCHFYERSLGWCRLLSSFTASADLDISEWKILFSFYGCFQRNQILGFLSHFPKPAACSPSMYRPESIFFFFFLLVILLSTWRCVRMPTCKVQKSIGFEIRTT